MNKPLRLIVLAKEPLPGYAKTRLIPALGAEGAARLAERMLHHTVRECARAELGTIELCVAPDAESAFWDSFRAQPGVVLSSQGEGDLGLRMQRAATRTCEAGESVILLGTDCPQLTAGRLCAAAAALAQADAAVYPTRDGGYALLGFHHVEPALFRDMPWSTAAVAQQTRERMALAGMHCRWLETLVDIDEAGDLEFLPGDWKAELLQ